MNVFRHEFRQYRRALIGWCAGIAVFLVVYLPFLPAFMEQSDVLRTFLQGLGGPVLRAMGIDIDLFLGPLGFYSYAFTFLSLIGAIQAAGIGLSVLSKENRMRAADFLFTKPKTRGAVFFEKLGASVLSLFITQAFFYALSSGALYLLAGQRVPFRPFALVSLSFTPLQFFFFSLGALVATAARRIKSVVSVSVGLAVGCFLLSMVSNLTGSAALRYVSPMRYFDTNYILLHGAYEPAFLWLSLSLTALMGALAFVLYVKRDIRAV